MAKTLHILILEDNPADAELVQFELQESGIAFIAQVVMTEKDFSHELQAFSPDIILSDYDLPEYTGALALAEAKRQCPNVPFILVTGAVSEDRAIEILTSGAKDYVMKTRLNRLAPAVRRALSEAEEIRARKEAEEELLQAHRGLETTVRKRTEALKAEITERKRIEAALQMTLQRLRTLVSSMRGGILVVGEEGIELVNQTFCDYFGLQESPAELIGLRPREIIEKTKNAYLHPDEEVNRIREIVRRGQPIIGEEVAMRDRRSCLRDFIPILVDEKTYCRMWYHMDITARKRAEEELEKKASQLEAANKELESFSYSVSHDLRAPLRAIDGYAKMILKKQGDKFDDETKRLFGQVRDSAKAMGQLIDDLLALARLGRQDLKLQILDARRMIDETWRELQSIYSTRPITLKIKDIPQGWGDSVLMKQVFVNILSNAIKFTRTRNMALIEIGGFENNDEIIYYVKDNGVGFDMQYHDKLFGVFQRLHPADEYEGTGIGLAIVQRIIHYHGGRIWAEGKVDEGAVFYFTLPVK